MSKMSKNASIRDFFKPKQPAANTLATPPSQPSSDIRIPPPAPPAIRSGNTPKPRIFSPPNTMGQAASTAETAPELSEREYTSSLSPPPSTLTSPESPKKENVAPQPLSLSNTESSERVIRNSDDEDEDSDSSLEDITTLFLTHRSSDTQPRQGTSGFTPSTPTASRYKNVNNFHSSPLTFQPKYKFDLKTLLSYAENDEATEASSNRVKAMMASKDVDEDAPMANSGAANPEKFVHGDVLESVVAEREDGGAHKVKRALMRTEATVSEKRWHFFDTEIKKTKVERKPFPTRSVSEEWRSELVNPETRYHSFISGFAEDLVELGKALPDELFLWMLDEVCIEASEPLRTSYLNTISLCSEQLNRLVVPETLQSLFRGLGGTQDATIITEKIRPVQAPPEHYSNRDWGKGNLLSVIRFLDRVTESLEQESRTYIVTMLLRMSVDRVVYENVDLLDLVQQTISHLCRYTPDDAWEAAVRTLLSTSNHIINNLHSVKKSSSRSSFPSLSLPSVFKSSIAFPPPTQRHMISVAVSQCVSTSTASSTQPLTPTA
jgi:hypothetical protein